MTIHIQWACHTILTSIWWSVWIRSANLGPWLSTVQYPLKLLQKASIPSWIHERSPFIDMKKKPVSTDFKCSGQGKQYAWPEKLKSVMHRLNSILSHEKRIKSWALAGKLAASELCATDRGTDIQSITRHENQLEAKSHHRLPQWGRSMSQWYDKWFMDSRPKMLKTGQRENARGGAESHNQTGKERKKVYKDRVLNWAGERGRLRALGASRQVRLVH